MKLNYREFGKGDALVILHGLYACSDNWIPLAKSLNNNNHIIIPDCRNHGSSPKSETHSYNDLSKDLIELVDSLNIEKISIVGHSMGGKTAMHFACKYPERVDKLIIIDIAPIDYNSQKYIEHTKRNNERLKLFDSINLKEVNSVRELSKQLQDLGLNDYNKSLILKNTHKNKNKQLSWKLNIPTIKKETHTILSNNLKLNDIFSTDCYFIKGEKSDYIGLNDYKTIKTHFPKAKIQIIAQSGHSPHIEQTTLLSEAINKILSA